jgi:hypothetical protein
MDRFKDHLGGGADHLLKLMNEMTATKLSKNGLLLLR